MKFYFSRSGFDYDCPLQDTYYVALDISCACELKMPPLEPCLQGGVSSYQQVILTLPINQPASHESECKGFLAVFSKTCLYI